MNPLHVLLWLACAFVSLILLAILIQIIAAIWVFYKGRKAVKQVQDNLAERKIDLTDPDTFFKRKP